ncbi:putative ribonuclease H-like domain-containing protein [Tanacetum coccineum]
MQDELLQFKLQKVCTLADLPYGKRAIRIKWVYKNKKDHRGIVVRNKTRLVTQGYTQEEGIDYDEVFTPVAMIEAIRMFLAYASFMNFVIYQMDVKSAFLYGKIEEEVYVCQPPGFEDPEFPDRVYKVMQKEDGIFISQDKYVDEILNKFSFLTVRIASTPMETSKPLLKDVEAEDVDVHLYRSMIGSLMYLTTSRPDIMFFYPKDSPFDLEAYSDSDYAGASLDRKSTTEVLWIQNQMLDYGYNFMNTKIFIDNESTICMVKNPVFHSKTKHIKIRHHFIRDSYEKRLIQVIKIHTDHNVAGLLTKALDIDNWNGAARQIVNAAGPMEGKSSGQPIKPQHTPTTALPSHVEPIPIVASSSQPKKTQKHRKTKRKATKIYQSSEPTTLIVDETVHKDRGDSVERAATTATTLDAKQGSGNINKTQSMEIPNDPFPQGIGLGGSLRRQDTMGDRPAQTRFERLSNQSNEPPLSRVNTLGSGEDSMKLQELMDLCTKLSNRVLDLENVKDAQALEIKKLKKRVKKLESKKKSRTPQLKRRLFRVRIKSSAKKSLGDPEDASKKGRNEIDQDEGISWFQEDAKTQGRYGHDIEVNTASTAITTGSINITIAKPVTTASAPVTTAGVFVSTTETSTPPTITTTTTPIEDEDLTIDQTFMKMKSEKSKAKGVTMKEPSESGTRVRVPPAQIDPKDKEKLRDFKQTIMDADYELAAKLQAEEQGEISIEERSKLFVELINERKKHFARLKVEEQRRKPLTKAQKRNQMSNYLKNMAGYTLHQLRGYSFDKIKTLFETTMRSVNTFVPIESEVDRAVPELAPGSSKRAKEEELDQESSTRQKTSESSELAEEPRDKEADELSQEELQQMMIIVPEKYWKIIRVGNHTEVHHFFDDMLKAFDRDDLVMLWSLVKEKFNLTEPTDDKEKEIWVVLKRLFEPDIDDELWKLQKHIHDLTWKLYDSCGVHHVSTEKGIDIYMLVEKEYPLSRRTLSLMLVVNLLVDQDNEMSRELLRKIFMHAERPRR